jgi:hypothetical protein
MARAAKSQRFTARIEKISVLRCVTVPPKVVTALGGGLRIPVFARYGGATTQSTLSPAGGKRRRLTLKLDVLRAAGIDAGDSVEVTLSIDPNPRFIDFPADLVRALKYRPAAAAALDRASPSTRRIVVELLEQSRTPETRQRRLEKLVERLAENAPDRATKV